MFAQVFLPRFLPEKVCFCSNHDIFKTYQSSLLPKPKETSARNVFNVQHASRDGLIFFIRVYLMLVLPFWVRHV